MGACFLTAQVVQLRGSTLDWDAATGAVDALEPDDLATAVGGDHGEADDDQALNRDVAKGIFADLQALLDADYRRDLGYLDVGEYEIHMAGGASSGDDPSDAFTVLHRAMWFPTVLTAIGFTLEGGHYG
ncbi:MAG: hypothetical protein L0H93_15405 [Nocardioides sp.]|nr:hypothetical protein [Nocardioides sp.]